MVTSLSEDLKKAYSKFIKSENFENAYYCLEHLWNEENKDDTYGMITEYRSLLINEIKAEGKKPCVDENRMKQLNNFRKMTYKLTAKDKFDDFMIFVEWNRATKDKYWLPRRAKLKPYCDALQDMEDNKLDELFLSMPPRTGKTTLIVFFVLWVMLRNSERSNLYTSYTQSVVDVFYSGLLEMLEDNVTYLWKEVFPKSVIASTNAKDLLINLDRKKRYASFTGRSLYGTLNGACDCNGYEIADDLISGIEEAMNKDRLESAWSKVDNNFLPRAKEGSKRIWIGTRWSIADPIARRIELLENDPNCANIRYKIVNVPALDENEESNFEYLFNVGFSTDYYKQRRASFERNNDIASWLAQYMGTPIERDGSVFRPEDMRYYNGILPDATPDRIFMAIDPAFGGGDFTASPICYQFGNDIYVVDVVYNDGDKRVTQPDIVSKAVKYGVQAMYVEATKMTASYAEGINDLLSKKNIKINMQTSTKHFTGTGKEQRIFDKSPEIRESMLFLQSGNRSRDYELFMQNVYSFTINGKNKHDDAPDSLAMAINMAFLASQVVAIRQRAF